MKKEHFIILMACLIVGGSASSHELPQKSRIQIEVGTLSVPEYASEWFLSEVHSFSRRYPHIDVVLVDVETPRRPQNPLHENLRLARNVIGIDSRMGYEVPFLVELGMLRSVGEFSGYEDAVSVFFHNDLTPVQYRGETWGIPWLTQFELLLCDWPLFEGVGIAEPPTTWNELLDYAQRLTRGTYQAGLRISISNDTVPMAIMSYVLQGGGQIFSEDHFDLSSPAVGDAVGFFRKLAFESGCTKMDSRPLREVLEDSTVRYGMHIIPVEDVRHVQHDSSLRLAPLPKGSQDVTMCRRRLYLAVRRASPEEEAASWKFVRWFTRSSISLPRELAGYPSVRTLSTRRDFEARFQVQDASLVVADPKRAVDTQAFVANRIQGYSVMWRGISQAIMGQGVLSNPGLIAEQANQVLQVIPGLSAVTADVSEP